MFLRWTPTRISSTSSRISSRQELFVIVPRTFRIDSICLSNSLQCRTTSSIRWTIRTRTTASTGSHEHRRRWICLSMWNDLRDRWSRHDHRLSELFHENGNSEINYQLNSSRPRITTLISDRARWITCSNTVRMKTAKHDRLQSWITGQAALTWSIRSLELVEFSYAPIRNVKQLSSLSIDVIADFFSDLQPCSQDFGNKTVYWFWVWIGCV